MSFENKRKLSINLHEKLWRFESDIEDFSYNECNKDFSWTDKVELDALHSWICEQVGHYVIDDQCMKPHHRFCVYCHKSMPYLKSEEWTKPRG